MFIIVTDENDAQLLLSLGYNQVRTFLNGYDCKHWVFLRKEETNSSELLEIGLQGVYLITDSLAF